MTQESRLVIVIDSRNAERNARAVAGELENLTKKGDQAETQMTAVGASIKSLVGYMGGILTINKAIAMADGYTQMAARIRNATASAEEYAMVQDRLLNTANTTYRQLGEAQEVYLSMAGGMKSLGYQTKETLDLTDSLSFSFTHNATRVDQAQSAMDALSKSMAKGKVDGDAWISIVTGADNVIADMAKQTGKTEAQIRKLGAEGKISLEELIKTLIATREQNEKLANNMENSLADGFTKLSNEVTVYLGKANESTSATGTLASGLGVLANNLELVANTGAAVGLGYVTTALLTKAAAVKQSLLDSTARRAADQIEIQSQIQLAGIETQRARQITALAIQEVHLARLELNSATTREARAAATMRLTQAEIALNIATKNTTTATAAYSAAQAAATTTSLTLAGAARSTLAFMTGPIGLGITIATVAAGYLLLGANSEKTTASLRENNETVGDAIVKYKELNSIQRDAQIAAERQKLEELNDVYRKASAELMVYASNMNSMGEFVSESQIELSQLFAEYKKTGDLDKFNTSVQNSSKISQDAKDKTANYAKSVYEAGDAAKTQKSFIDQLSGSLNNAGNAGNNAAAGIRNAADATREYTATLEKRLWDEQFKNTLITKHNKSQNEANLLLEAYNENAKKGYAGVTSEQKKAIKGIESERIAMEKREQAQRNAVKSSQKVESDAARQAKQAREKAQREAKQLAEEQFNLRESIYYEFADRAMQIEKDLQNKIADIQKANFSPEMTAGYIQNAKNRAELEKEIFISQVEFELNEFNLTEEAKLKKRYEINKLVIQANRDLSNENRDIALQLSEQQYQHELGLIKLAKETRIFQANQAIYSEMELIQKRYELERRKIMEIQDLEERSGLLAGSYVNQAQDESALKDNTLSAYSNIMGYEESPLVQQFEVLQKMRELDLLNEEAYQNAKLQLQAKSTAGYMEGMLGGFASLVDENSKTYAVLFAAQKAFAVAQAMLNIPAAYSKAYDAVVGTPYVGPYIAPVVGAAAAALQVAQATQIKSTTMSGFKSGGYTGNYGVNQEAGVVHGQEYVLNAAATRRVGVDTLNAINNGGTIQAEKQAQANVKAQSQSPQIIDNQLRVVMVKDESEAKDMLYGPDGEKAFLYHMKRNRSKV